MFLVFESASFDSAFLQSRPFASFGTNYTSYFRLSSNILQVLHLFYPPVYILYIQMEVSDVDWDICNIPIPSSRQTLGRHAQTLPSNQVQGMSKKLHDSRLGCPLCLGEGRQRGASPISLPWPRQSDRQPNRLSCDLLYELHSSTM